MATQTLNIQRPMRSSRISQHFGENKACLYSNGKIVGKRNGVCPQGSDEYYPQIGLRGHNGVDYPGLVGESICHSGLYTGIMKTESDPAGGLGVDVISKEELAIPEAYVSKNIRGFLNSEDRNGVRYYFTHVKIRYWHVLTPIGWENKEVEPGMIVALCGNTGASSAPHLHMGVKLVNKDGEPYDKWNGYYGAFNFEPFLDNSIFVGDSVEYLGIGIPALTPAEQQTLNSQLSVLKRVLLAVREQLARIL